MLNESIKSQPKTDLWLQQLLTSAAKPLLKKVLSTADSFQYQVIYTRIDRDANNQPHFKKYYLNVDRNRYFNPASTVKLPASLAALEKLNSLKMPGVNKETTMLTDSAHPGQTPVKTDSTSKSGLPSVGHYIKKVFLVSDNDAYSRLYEFTGQQALNEMLWKKGYKDVRITRRFVPMTPEENRYTNPVRFILNNKVLYTQPEAQSNIQFDFSKKILIGRAHYDRNEKLVNEPMDFTMHNNLPLEDLQNMLQSVMFPSSVAAKQRFNLSDDDYKFLYQYMSALPSASDFPSYDTSEFFDSYTKSFYKAGRQKIPSYIRIFNKPGWSYGFLTDCAYVADFKNKVEFMLSAVIYVNADGVLNDDKYEYEETGYPFFKELYEVIYEYELKRERKYRPRWPGIIPGKSP